MAQVYVCLLSQPGLNPRSGALGWMQAPHQTGSWRSGWMAEDTPTGEPLLILKELCAPTDALWAQTRQMAVVRQKTLPGPLWLGSCGFPTASGPSAYSSKRTRWKPALSRERGPRLRRSFRWGGTASLLVFLPAEAAASCPRPCRAPNPGVPCSGAQPAREGSPSLRSHCWFPRVTCGSAGGRIQNGVLPTLLATRDSAQSLPLLTLAPAESQCSPPGWVHVESKRKQNRPHSSLHATDCLMVTARGQ